MKGAAEQGFLDNSGMLEWASRRELCVTMGTKQGDSFPLVLYPCDFHNRGQFFIKGASPQDPLRPEALTGACISGTSPADYAQAMVVPCLFDPTVDSESQAVPRRLAGVS